MLKDEWIELAKGLGYDNEQALFLDLYETMPISEIAKRLGFSTATIARRMSLLGISKRPRGGANNHSAQKFKLWRIDQRVVFLFTNKDVARALRMSYSTLYSYIASCQKTEWPDGILRDQPNLGTGEVGDKK